MTLRTSGFATMLVLTMAYSSFTLFAFAVVASDLQDEFDLSNLQIGLLGAANTGVGGLFSLVAGPLTDRLGGRWAMTGVLTAAAIGGALAAMSQSYNALLAALAVGGIAQGWGNPATNRAIADGVAVAQRGLLTGIKQAGIQVGVFIAGFGMPAVTAAWGWRAGMWMLCGASLATMLGLTLIADTKRSAAEHSEHKDAPTVALPTYVYQVAMYGFLLGTIGGGMGRFLPLFAEEQVGLSPTLAGIVFGIGGLIAIPSRIGWGVLLDRGMSTRQVLTICGVGGIITMALLLGAIDQRIGLLWVATLLAGVTLSSWNTAANVAMIREAKADAGRATGVLYLGFLFGITVGGPAVGWSIDRFDGYGPAWTASLIVCALGVVALAPAIGRLRQPSASAAR
ncbi:MAG: MFS transporter [Acidimicrobiales bacterium]|nr:MFS transporter [Acidimicrobiales bacterium]